MTIETRSNIRFAGITQVHAKPDIGLTFAKGLTTFLRQDPDIIMVGEIRDVETADIAVKAALTGHLVLSTIHTNDAASTIQRLVNMGVESFLVTASLNMIVAQRLCRRICEHCKEITTYSEEIMTQMGLAGNNAPLYRGAGCEQCRGTGYRKRVALYEVLVVSDPMRDQIIAGVSSTEIKRIAIREGMQTLRAAGLNKVLESVTTIEEVVASSAPDN